MRSLCGLQGAVAVEGEAVLWQPPAPPSRIAAGPPLPEPSQDGDDGTGAYGTDSTQGKADVLQFPAGDRPAAHVAQLYTTSHIASLKRPAMQKVAGRCPEPLPPPYGKVPSLASLACSFRHQQ